MLWSVNRAFSIGGSTFSGDCWFSEDSCSGGSDVPTICGGCGNNCPGGCTPGGFGIVESNPPTVDCSDFSLNIPMTDTNCGLIAGPDGVPRSMDALVTGDVVLFI